MRVNIPGEVPSAHARTAPRYTVRWMRINVILDDALLEEAVRLSGYRSRQEVIEAALRAFIEVNSAPAGREALRARLSKLDAMLANLRLRQRPSELLHEDRDRS